MQKIQLFPCSKLCFHLRKDEIKRNRQSRRLEASDTEVGKPHACNATLTYSNVNVQESLGDSNLENQLIEPSHVINDNQVWTQIMEHDNGRIVKMRKEMENKFEVTSKEIRTNKSASTITNPRSETNET